MGAPEFMVGTASWTDKTLIETTDFYPPDVKTAEDRLRFYAAQFKTVEVDSTYYAIPAERNAELWHQRTPPGFVFHIKAFAWLTQHPTDASRLPKGSKGDAAGVGSRQAPARLSRQGNPRRRL